VIVNDQSRGAIVFLEDSGKLYALAPPGARVRGQLRATAPKIGASVRPKSAPGNSENTRALRTYAGE
jgi:hypothetical protein